MQKEFREQTAICENRLKRGSNLRTESEIFSF